MRFLSFTRAITRALTTTAFAFAFATPASAQNDVAPPAITDVDDSTTYPHAVRRQALFDLGFTGLVDGNLIVAERAFAEAAALPGDPAASAVADMFVERVQQLRERRRVAAEARARAIPRPARDVGRTERTALLGATTALGLGLYGWTLPSAFGVDPSSSTRGFVGVYMLTSASAFIVPYLLLRNQPVTAGQANMSFYGGTRGIWHGVLLGAMIAGELGPDRRPRAWQASMLLGSVAGLVGGYQLAKATDLSAGQARTVAAVGDLGLLMGFGSGFLLRLDGGPRFCGDPNFFVPCPQSKSPDAQSRGMATSGLVGTGLALGAGYYLARHRQNSWGDGEVLRASIALGVWTAAGIADLGKMNFAFSNRPFTGMLMAGGALGLFAGDWLVRDTNFTAGQSMLVDLSTISGGLLGAGTAYLASSGNDDDGPYILASALGAGLGFGLAYWGFHDSAESRTTAGLSRLSASKVALVPTVGTFGERGLALAGLF